MEEWIRQLYSNVKQQWTDHGKNECGYAIFYSPVFFQPDIMIIGYNPGGNENDFDENNIEMPTQHDYFAHVGTKDDYKLAKQMRQIFEYAGLKDELKESVKLNLIFFRSKKSNDLTNTKLIEFSKQEVKKIIDGLQPKIIITEGFKTFDEILRLYKGEKNNKEIPENKPRRIIRAGTINGKVKVDVLGLIHPSGAHGISDIVLRKLAKFIYKKVNKQI